MESKEETKSKEESTIFSLLKGERVDRAPVWLMRQAGLYLPEYKEIRATNDFFTICRTPPLACEVTMQPLRRFDVDAAIIFSDILVVPQALGMECVFVPSKGPVFTSPLSSPSDVEALQPIRVEEKLQYVFDALSVTRKAMESERHVPLFGFSGGPWTLMAYMFEGHGSETFSKAKTFLYTYPEHSLRLLRLLTQTLIDYLVAQVSAGAEMLMIFESHAGQLSPHMYDTFLSPFLHEIVETVRCRVAESAPSSFIPIGVFAKGAHYALEDLSTFVDILGLDWTIDPAQAVCRVRKATEKQGRRCVLQGNLDPCVLYAPVDVIRSEVRKMMEGFGDYPVIANLGHGVHHAHTPEAVKTFVDIVHEVSAELYTK